VLFLDNRIPIHQALSYCYCDEHKQPQWLRYDLTEREPQDLTLLYPEQYAPEEYSFYFEQCYNDPLARKRFIESIVSARKPAIGYLCLAEAVAKGKVKNVWTTNFDPLLENALNQLYPINNVLVCSEANRGSIRSLNPQYP
jgi:hypothetical protein